MPSEQEGPPRKRLRTSHACDACRLKKIRCNGNHPCAACVRSKEGCTYGSEANSRGKSDIILESVLRVEQMLLEMSTILKSPPARPDSLANPSPTSPQSCFSEHRTQDRQRRLQSEQNSTCYLENAVLDSMHTSTTESILQWPHFDAFPSLRNDCISNFELEQSRPPIKIQNKNFHSYVSNGDISLILDVFNRKVNFWYPTMSYSQLEAVHTALADNLLEDDTPESCLALLTMALGCASNMVDGLTTQAAFNDETQVNRSRNKSLGDMYFDAALKKLHVAHTEISPTATHCLFFIAIYFAFLARPLQAWEYINCAATKCLLLLSYPPRHEIAEDQERIRRIFWSCYILESDYLAELSGLPQSGIARIESSVQLPGAVTNYPTHASDYETEQSCLYFLACISMRRLLNRVHQLLYARDTGASLNVARFPYVVAELSHQLDEWRNVLPAAFAFSVGYDCEPTATEAGGFLRQRYLTCRSVIFRPYLMWMLSGVGGPEYSNTSVSDDVLAHCKVCLDACLLHILNLRGFGQTVLVDSWICSLSMAGGMLVLLAACRVPSLKRVMSHKVLSAGTHLQRLFEDWQQLSGDPYSPSANQALQIIRAADKFIKVEYREER